MKRLAIISDNNNLLVAFVRYFANQEFNIDIYSKEVEPAQLGQLLFDYDLIIVDDNKEICENLAKVNLPIIRLHSSLLPAFDSQTPVIDSYMFGVKVTGITISTSSKILLQYPILIGNLTHFDELEEKLQQIKYKICPIVVEKFLNNEVIDFDALPNTNNCGGCSGGCGNCGNH